MVEEMKKLMTSPSKIVEAQLRLKELKLKRGDNVGKHFEIIKNLVKIKKSNAMKEDIKEALYEVCLTTQSTRR